MELTMCQHQPVCQQWPVPKAQRAEENRAYVRKLLRERQPAFAAALAAAEEALPCPGCPCRQREMLAHPLGLRSNDETT